MKDGSKKLRAESAEVLYAVGGIVTVDAATVAALVHDAGQNPRRRIRLCTHTGVEDAVHEMMIVHDRSCYVRPHKHVGKSESFHVVEGEVDVVIFDDAGTVTGVIPMGPFGSERPFFYRIDQPLFHTLLIRSDVLVFHETTSGPFRREQTVFAPWAPEEDDRNAVNSFLAQLNDIVAARRGLQA